MDLYNYAYWWESHEAFEGLWHAAGHATQQGRFFQALIQVAASNLKRVLGQPTSTANLARAGLARLQEVPPIYMGMDVESFAADVQAHWEGSRQMPPLIRLAW